VTVIERQTELEPGLLGEGSRQSRIIRLGRWIGHKQDRFGLAKIPIGIVAALVAVTVRYLLPMEPTQLPALTVVIAVALTGTFVGLSAGLVTAVVGGLLSWYLFFTPYSWELNESGAIILIGFFITSLVILATSHLYRLSEQRHHQAQLAAAQKDAEAAQLFAREMAHRLKNALAIVQSIAFQTLGQESAETAKFAARLKALASAHDLLAEHVQKPTAEAAELVRATLEPFDHGDRRAQLQGDEVRLAASQAVSLALAVHELATNAAKHGALTTAKGTVAIRIEDEGDAVRLTWKERGGPPVQAPAAHGFGTSLLRRLDPRAELRFEPDGLCCSLSLRKA
jgi:two-component sensor histidine kinase